MFSRRFSVQLPGIAGLRVASGFYIQKTNWKDPANFQWVNLVGKSTI